MSVAMLVALLFLLPGAAVVYGASRVNTPVRPSPLDAQLSASLAVAFLSALVLNAVWYAFWLWTARTFGMLRPDIELALALMMGDLNDAHVIRAISSMKQNPIRIAVYVGSITFIGYAIGRAAGRLKKKEGGALWSTLFSPPETHIVCVTVDVLVCGSPRFFTGILLDFGLNPEGGLDRLVLQEVYRGAPGLAAPDAEDAWCSQLADAGDWQPAANDLVVISAKEVQSLWIDYVLGVDPPRCTAGPDPA